MPHCAFLLVADPAQARAPVHPIAIPFPAVAAPMPPHVPAPLVAAVVPFQPVPAVLAQAVPAHAYAVPRPAAAVAIAPVPAPQGIGCTGFVCNGGWDLVQLFERDGKVYPDFDMGQPPLGKQILWKRRLRASTEFVYFILLFRLVMG